MAPLELNVLGAFHMNLGAQTVTHMARGKARALLTFLALEGMQPRTTLTALLWPYLPQETAFDHLRKTLYRLRRKLDEGISGAAGILIADHQSVRLDPAQIVVDVVRFQTLLAECQRHAHTTLTACEACLARLADAADCYQGELLSSFALDDAPAFEEWLLLRRETLHHQALQTLVPLATAWEVRGDFARAQHYCSRILSLDPFNEEAHRQQMRLFVALGQRNHALQQYQTCRRLLHDELGVEPEAATVALYEQIRRGDLLPLPLSPLVASQAPLAEATLPLKWGEVPETGHVYGREMELAQIHRWLSDERCQIVAIFGIGGMGKSTLAAASATRVAADFDKVLWRSLLNAPPIDELLTSVLQGLARQPLGGLPSGLDEQLILLLNELRQQRCLLIFDNLESLLQPEGIGQMRAGYEGYMQLIRQLAEQRHNSTLLLTSRERAQAMARWEKDLPWVRSLKLEGLDSAAGQEILAAHGLASQGGAGNSLVARYSGHPLALKLVAETIQELFEGNIAAFLAYDVVIFDDIRAVLDQQFARLPALEQEIIVWLAIEREPVLLETLRADLVPARSMQEIVQALRALQRRSLVQATTPARAADSSRQPMEPWANTKFGVPNVIMEYLIERWVEIACHEIEQEQLLWLHKYAVMQAQAMEYIRQSQMRLILQPIATHMEALLGRNGVAPKVLRLLQGLRAEVFPPRGYAVGNLLNLLILLEIDVGTLDLAGLAIWQADLRRANLAGSNLTGADLTGSRFADAFNMIRTVAISPDGALVAGGTQGGEVRLWDTESGRLIHVYRGHTGAVRTIAFRPDGRVLASGSEDRTVHLWAVEDSYIAASDIPPFDIPLFARLLQGHTGRVTSVAFTPDGKILASASSGGAVRLWEVASGEVRGVLHGHEGGVSALAIAPDGRTLASGGYDRLIRLWDLETTEVRATLIGHTELVSSLAFDQSGARLASGSYDCTVCLWDPIRGQLIYSFEAATDLITSVAFSPDGERLATGGDDSLIRLWNTRTANLESIFYGHMANVSALAFSPNGETLVSGGDDQKLCLWDVATNRICRLFSGHSQSITSIAFHPDGKMLASGHYDHLVRLWDLDTHELRQLLYGHTLKVNSVAFSADGKFLASGSNDKSVHMWAISAQGNARRNRVLRGHQGDVVAIDFHPDGKTLVSGSEDMTIGFWGVEEGQLRRALPMDDMPFRSTKIDAAGKLLASDSLRYIRLWDVSSGLLYTKLRGHADYIWSLAFSPDSHWLASGGIDGSIGLWDIGDPSQARHVASLHGHTDRVFIVAFHPNGRFLASGSADHTLRIWDMRNHEVVHTLTGHTHWVWTLAFSPDGSIIASSGLDATIRLWDSESGKPLAVLRAPGPYAGMNISGVTGITEAQKTALKALGAYEQSDG